MAVNKVEVTPQEGPLSGIAMMDLSRDLLRGSRKPRVGCVAIILHEIAAAAAVEEEGDSDKEILE
jgi:hypothetical protein